MVDNEIHFAVQAAQNKMAASAGRMLTEKQQVLDKYNDALRPFARLDIHHLKAAPDDRPIWQLNETPITVGDVRAAKRALNMEVDEFDPSLVDKPESLGELGDFAKKSGKV